jgi:hypothetical protein
MFAGSELPRLMTMIVMLGVIFMLITRARIPSTWSWFAPPETDEWQDTGAPGGGAAAKAGPAEKSPAAKTAPAKNPPVKTVTPAPAKTSTEINVSVEAKTPARGEGDSPIFAAPLRGAGENRDSPPPAEEIVPGPTDEDQGEAESVEEEYLAITDKTESIQPEEVEAYDRVVRWVRAQSFRQLLKRASEQRKQHAISYGDLVRSPEDYRGKIIDLKLNARMVRKFEKKNRDGVQLYEVWGFTGGSGNFLYDTVVVERPAGLPLGDTVKEQVRFVGYFFKLQGYEPRGANLGDPVRHAPMLIGRIVRSELADEDMGGGSDWSSSVVILIAVAFAALITVRLVMMFWPKRRGGEIHPLGKHYRPMSTPDQWLTNERPLADLDGNNLGPPSDSSYGGEKGNGQPQSGAEHYPEQLDDDRPRAE